MYRLRLSVFERVQQQNYYIYKLLIIYIYVFRHCDTLNSYCIQIFTGQDRWETYISFIGCPVMFWTDRCLLSSDSSAPVRNDRETVRHQQKIGAEVSGHFGTSCLVPKCLGAELSWCRSVLTPKDLALFSYIYPRKSPLSMIKYELLTSCQQLGKKIGPSTNPATRLCEKFLSLMRYNLFIGVNEMRVKILPLLCRLGSVLRLGSV